MSEFTKKTVDDDGRPDPLDDTKPTTDTGNVFVDAIRQFNGAVTVVESTQPDGDKDINVLLDQYGAQNLIDDMRQKALNEARAAGMETVPDNITNFLDTLETSVRGLCEDGPVTTENPEGKIMYNTMRQLATTLGALTPELDAQLKEQTNEKAVRDLAAENGQSYIDKLTMTCTNGA